MGLFSDVIKSIGASRPQLFTKLQSLKVPVKNNNFSVVAATFAQSKKDKSFALWTAELIASNIRKKSAADGDDPTDAKNPDTLVNSILFILDGGYTDVEYKKTVAALPPVSKKEMIVIGVIVFIILIIALKLVKLPVKWALSI